jgi:hypothetical protein
LESRQEVCKIINKHFPNTNWQDPSWGIFETSWGFVEFNMGSKDISDGFMLHVRARQK